jgi:hypothetical protein
MSPIRLQKRMQVLLPGMADHFIGLAPQKAVDGFQDVLQSSGPVHGQPRPQDGEQDDKDKGDQHLHGDEVGPRFGRVFDVDPDQGKDGVGRAGKVPVQQRGDPQLMFGHKSTRI